MTGVTLKETHHGNPGEICILPVGLLVQLEPATNLPDDAKIQYWARPLKGHPWPKETASWADYLAGGVGLGVDDVKLVDDVKPCGRTIDAEGQSKRDLTCPECGQKVNQLLTDVCQNCENDRELEKSKRTRSVTMEDIEVTATISTDKDSIEVCFDGGREPGDNKIMTIVDARKLRDDLTTVLARIVSVV